MLGRTAVVVGIAGALLASLWLAFASVRASRAARPDSEDQAEILKEQGQVLNGEQAGLRELVEEHEHDHAAEEETPGPPSDSASDGLPLLELPVSSVPCSCGEEHGVAYPSAFPPAPDVLNDANLNPHGYDLDELGMQRLSRLITDANAERQEFANVTGNAVRDWALTLSAAGLLSDVESITPERLGASTRGMVGFLSTDGTSLGFLVEPGDSAEVDLAVTDAFQAMHDMEAQIQQFIFLNGIAK